MNITAHAGELAALSTAFCWTITALTFSQAARKLGALTMNLIRLVFAFFFLGVLGLITRGQFLPLDASLHNWIWLGVSGLVGLVFGDFCLFSSYLYIPARIAALIMALAPPIAAFTGWLLFGETLTMLHLTGMALTLSGIALVVLQRPDSQTENPSNNRFKHSGKGIWLAIGGAVGQGVGLVLSKFGMNSYDAFAATHIRIMAGIVGFSVLFTLLNNWVNVRPALANKSGMRDVFIGSIFGPFLGISLSLLSVQYTSSGVASTIMAIVPVLIILPAVLIYKERVTWMEILGALISVAGVGIMFVG